MSRLLNIFVTVNRLNGTVDEFTIDRDISTWNITSIEAPAATKFSEGSYLLNGFMFDVGYQVIDGEEVYVNQGESYTNQGYDIFGIWETYTEYEVPTPPTEDSLSIEVVTQLFGNDVDSIERIGYYNVYIDNQLCFSYQVTPLIFNMSTESTYRIESFAEKGYKTIFPVHEGNSSWVPIIFEKLSNVSYIKTNNGWKQGVSYVNTKSGWREGTPSAKKPTGWSTYQLT